MAYICRKLGLHNSLMEKVKERIPKYFGHTVRKSLSLEKNIIEGMMPGSRAGVWDQG